MKVWIGQRQSDVKRWGVWLYLLWPVSEEEELEEGQKQQQRL